MTDLRIDPAVPENIREVIKRAIGATRSCVEENDREHVAFLISQYIQQAYWMGNTDGMKEERKIWRKP